MRQKDWSRTSFGPVSEWPQSLRSATSIMLNSRYPIALYWGAKRALVYNDDWAPILGNKHPWALSRPAKEVWPEIWDEIDPLFHKVFTTGEGVWAEDQLLAMNRHGYTEECYFNFTFSPIQGESGQVEGIFNAVVETTDRVLSERRLRTLTDLGAHGQKAKETADACIQSATILENNLADVPFALIYLTDKSEAAVLVAASNIQNLPQAAPEKIDLREAAGTSLWPLGTVFETGESLEVSGPALDAVDLPTGSWPEPTRHAIILPLALPGQARPAGFLVAGVNPRRHLDSQYRAFFSVVASHIATAIANAQAYEEERNRAEALAEIDKAKTLFFSNVSHEFRTPLTLMLGPLEETLRQPGLGARDRAELEIAHRNGLRLLKLVNSLLDFSRVEAGRTQASYVPTDLSVLTSDLASNFRSACEKAGLELVIDCPPLPEKIYVDRDIWEKIVFNLLSNAFKFTFEGGITVTLRVRDAQAVLQVSDTGIGIPAEELPHIFERFHRVEQARGRTHEGTGIGLALVKELVKLHAGSIRVESVPQQGTTFTVQVPMGSAHLPSERIGAARSLASTATRAEAFVEEALRWLPADNPSQPVAVESQTQGKRFHVLLADDNADMRDYVQRILLARYGVTVVADGQAAWEAARTQRPDLIVSDVMMPRLDGFGLLKMLRGDPELRDIPVILLSARAGQEAEIEGIEAGADDYLVKPFSARELSARVDSLLNKAQERRQQEEHFRIIADSSPAILWITGPDGACEYLSKQWYEYTGGTPGDDLGFGWLNKVHPDDLEQARGIFLAANQKREGFSIDYRLRGKDGGYRWAIDAGMPRFDERGGFLGFVGCVFDVHDRKLAEESLKALTAESERQRRLYDTIISSTPDLVYVFDLDYRFTFANEALLEMWGRTLEESVGKRLLEIGYEPWHAHMHEREIDQVVATKRPIRGEVSFPHATLGRRIYDYIFVPVLNEAGEVESIAGTTRDITDIKRAEERFRALVTASSDVVYRMSPDWREMYHLQGREFLADTDDTSSTWLQKYIHPEDQPTVMAAIEAAIRKKSVFELEHRVFRTDGTLGWTFSRALPLLDEKGEIAEWFGAASDVSERKRIEAVLEGQKKALELSISGAPLKEILEVFIHTVELQSKEEVTASVLLLDDAGQRLIHGAAPGLPESYNQAIDGIRIGPAVGSCGTAAFKGETVIVGDIENDPLWADFKDIALAHGLRACWSVPIISSERKVLGTFALYYPRKIDSPSAEDMQVVEILGGTAALIIDKTIDMRLRKAAEEKLKANAAALRQADRRKDEFLATLAHELRNPLAPIANALHIMRMSDDPKAAGEMHAIIGRQLELLVRLVDDLLDLSRITRGKIELRKERIALSDIVATAVETVNSVIEQRSQRLVISLASESLWLDGDTARLSQVFSNILNNAAKYTQEGGVIELKARIEGSEAVISVEDNGIGIPPSQLPTVFEMFTQVESSLGRSQGGLGIGLTLVDQLVKLHGGRVEAHSEGLGKGSCFSVHLPLSRRESVQPESVGIEPPQQTERALRVLVVDDNKESAKTLASIVELLGHDVRSVHSGCAALEVAAEFVPAIALLDIGMPEMDGYEVCRLMKRMPELAGTIFVAQTGWSDKNHHERSKKAGFDHHLAKPVDIAALKGLLANAASCS